MLGSRGIRFQDPGLGNSSPWIYVWSSWAVIACTVFVALRLWVRRGRFGLDDVFNLFCYLSALASCAVVFSALHHGLGSPEPFTDVNECTSVASLVVTSVCLLLLTDGLSKCSTTLLVRRIITSGASPLALHRLTCTIVVGIVLAWTVISASLLGSGCSSSCSLGHGTGTACHVRGTRLVVVLSIGILLEAVIFVLAAFFFGTLHMSWRLKTTTLVLFAVRLPVIAFSIVFVTHYRRYIANVDHGLTNIGAGIYWQMVYLTWTTISPCLQALKSTAEAMYTSGAAIDGSRAGSVSRSYRLHNLSSPHSSKQRAHSAELQGRLRPDGARSVTQVYSQNSGIAPDLDASESFASDRMIIRQERAWDVSIDRSDNSVD